MAADLSALTALTDLARALQRREGLERMLQALADQLAALLAVERVSVRLFNADGSRLVAACRAGQPLHETPVEFEPGEGLIGFIAKQGAPLRLDDAEAHPAYAARPGKRASIGGFLGVPLMGGDSCLGVVSAVGGETRAFSARDEQLAVLATTMCAPHLEIARLARLASVDPLTGALNRRGLDESYPMDDEDAALSVAMLDLDHFKRVNDTHGHAVGDRVLAHVATRIAAASRGGDGLVRYGGEEFLLILPGVGLETARRIAERVRVAVAGDSLPHGDGSIPVTVSIGVATRRDGETRDALVERADEAMYRAKRAGRDRVEIDP